MRGTSQRVSLLMVLAGTIYAQPRAIDTAKSTLTVAVSKTGALAMMGHDHTVSAPIAAGTVDATARKVELRVNTASMRVTDEHVSDKDRAQIQQTMLGSDVLDAAKFPAIVFQSTSAEPAASGSWNVRGTLALHGATQPVAFQVRENGGRYTGEVRFKQSAFGIKPVSVAGGTVKVKDEISIRFDIQLAQ